MRIDLEDIAIRADKAVILMQQIDRLLKQLKKEGIKPEDVWEEYGYIYDNMLSVSIDIKGKTYELMELDGDNGE